MKKIRGDEPIGVLIHIYLEISQGNPCVAIFISNKQYMLLFLSFLFIILQNWRTRGLCRSCPGWGLVQVCGGGGWERE
jgi:hypothetical protein